MDFKKDVTSVKRRTLEQKIQDVKSPPKKQRDSLNPSQSISVVRSWDLKPNPKVPEMPDGQGQYQMKRSVKN